MMLVTSELSDVSDYCKAEKPGTYDAEWWRHDGELPCACKADWGSLKGDLPGNHDNKANRGYQGNQSDCGRQGHVGNPLAVTPAHNSSFKWQLLLLDVSQKWNVSPNFNKTVQYKISWKSVQPLSSCYVGRGEDNINGAANSRVCSTYSCGCI